MKVSATQLDEMQVNNEKSNTGTPIAIINKNEYSVKFRCRVDVGVN